MKTYDLIIIGGGPAGLAAAVAAKDNGIDNILILERDKSLGGILQQCIHNGFGLHTFKEELTGAHYVSKTSNLVFDYYFGSNHHDDCYHRWIFRQHPKSGHARCVPDFR